MATKVLFVHGTGVREDGYKASVSVIKRQLADHAPGVMVAECRWGESVGAKLNRGGASIPTYGESRGVTVSEREETQALWNLLLQDPSFELGMLNAVADKPEPGPPNVIQPAKELAGKFDRLAKSKDLKKKLADLTLDRFLAQAVTQLQASSSFKAIMISPKADQPQCRDALARALVASLVRASLDVGGPALDSAARDSLVKSIAALLGHDMRGVFSFVTAPFKGLAESVVTWQIRRKRTSLSDATYPAAGDILVYQANGDAIRKFIRDEVDKLHDDNVFVLAHSLGGIASFEMLVQNRPPNVKGFVTFGSQVPFFYEIGALKTLGSNDPLPTAFPSWINFYDLNDPLSYVGEKLFGKERLSDYKVESGESFPASHSAYLHSREFWIHVASFVRQHA